MVVIHPFIIGFATLKHLFKWDKEDLLVPASTTAPSSVT